MPPAPAGPAASLHPPSAGAALVQTSPGSLARPVGECTPRCRGVPRHRASALLPGAAPRNDFFIHSLFTQLGNPVFWETPGTYLFNVHHFTKALNETRGKNCDWPNFVKNKVPLVVRYTLTVHICTSSTQLDYLDLMILGFFSKLNDSNSNLPRDMAESPPPEVFKMQLDKVVGSLI